MQFKISTTYVCPTSFNRKLSFWLIWQQSVKWLNSDKWFHFALWDHNSCCNHYITWLSQQMPFSFPYIPAKEMFEGCYGRPEVGATEYRLGRLPISAADSLLNASICPDWLKIWGDTLSLLMDFIAVSLHSLVLFLLTVFFLSPPLSSYSSRSQTEMTSCRGEVGLAYVYPQGPAGEPGTNGERGICSTGGWDIYQGGKYNAWKGNSWHGWSSSSNAATTRGLKCGKCPLCFDLMMRRDRAQTDGMGGLLMKGDWVKKQ